MFFGNGGSTSEVEPRRYTARFFVAGIAGGDGAAHDEVETVDSEWLTPAAALQGFLEGKLFLAPPTYRTLVELSEFSSVERVLEAARVRETPEIMPLLEPQENGNLRVMLPGHPKHPSTERVEGPVEFTMDYSRFNAG